MKATDRPTLERIEDAALSCFADLGYHAASMRRIAAMAKVQPASMYHWYPSKEVLLVTLMERFMDGLSAKVEAAVEGTGDPWERLASAVRAHVVYHGSRRRSAFVADTEVRALQGESRARIVGRRDAYQQFFEGLIQDGVDAGEFQCSNVRIATYAILLECTGVSAWFRPDGPLSLERVADIHVELVLASLGAPPVGASSKAPSPGRDHGRLEQH